ncbi:PREDICTED: uncharacterized protein LOC106744611 [Dinoponera quadriceps]|uniref:Uncharacterized protein LOC106744611 n=1 Tax=Dinoponera quadriceps TaxID=609295 RepID=A0A6P3X9P1_DINQU|nr:PREDICTED: uncharacterized protein LOC106744611 [Dinoponera quadriceps]
MATYMTEWYRLPPKTALGLLLINMRSNFNIHLTAGKMVDLSLYTFGNVMKASVTYLNMLRQITS